MLLENQSRKVLTWVFFSRAPHNFYVKMVDLVVGKRVGIEKRRGFIRYVGTLNEVGGGKDLWLGIDWDNAEFGKHDGSLKGTRYFQTR
jgi:dynactin complex subunit